MTTDDAKLLKVGDSVSFFLGTIKSKGVVTALPGDKISILWDGYSKPIRYAPEDLTPISLIPTIGKRSEDSIDSRRKQAKKKPFHWLKSFRRYFSDFSS